MPYRVLDPSTAAAAPASTAGAALTSIGETLASFETELREELGGRPVADISAARLDKWINKAYRYTCGMIDIKELWGSVAFSLVLNQPFYLVPNNLVWIKRAALQDTVDYIYDGGIPLDEIDEATYRGLPDDNVIVLDTTYTPLKWFRWARMLVVWPYPTTARTLAVDFRARPADLAAATDSPILRPEFHEVILLFAKERALRATGATYGEVQAAHNDALMVLRPLLNSDAEERDAMQVTMTPVRSMRQLTRSPW